LEGGVEANQCGREERDKKRMRGNAVDIDLHYLNKGAKKKKLKDKMKRREPERRCPYNFLELPGTELMQ
jgi:hypothetical protein